MPSGNPIRPLQLAGRELRQLTNKPLTIEPASKFKPVKLNVARFDDCWQRKRGAAARLTAVLLIRAIRVTQTPCRALKTSDVMQRLYGAVLTARNRDVPSRCPSVSIDKSLKIPPLRRKSLRNRSE